MNNINKKIFIIQLSNEQNSNAKTTQIKNGTFLKANLLDINRLSPLEKIIIKIKINKIINAYKKYKRKNLTIISQYTNENENITTEDCTGGVEYIGARDSKGNKQGFGIQKMADGSKFVGVFTNDKVNGWGIYHHKDGDVYKGEYINDKTNG